MVEPPIWKICLSNWIISPGRGEQITRFETTTTLLKYTSPPPQLFKMDWKKKQPKRTIQSFCSHGMEKNNPQKKTELSCGIFFACSICLFLFTTVFGGCVSYSEDNHHSQSLRTPARRFRDSSWKKSPAAEVGPQERLHKKKHHLQFLVEAPTVYIDLWLISVIGGGYKSLHVYVYIYIRI